MRQLKCLMSLSLAAVVLMACTSTSALAPEATTPAHLSPIIPTDTPLSPSPVIPTNVLSLLPVTPTETPSSSPKVPTVTPFPSPAPLTKAAIESCPVTFPNGSNRPRERYPSPDRHGNGTLWADPGPGGKIVARLDPANKDGSIVWKMGWDRGVRGELTVTGRRLDAPAPPAQGLYDSSGYGDIGFQAGAIHFPSEGCWEITGRVSEASLTFVTLVVKVPFDPAWPHWGPEGLVIKDQDVTGLPKTIRLIFGPYILGEGQVTWGEGEVSIETTQGSRDNPDPYPDAATQQVTVNGQPGVCMQGTWDEQDQWQAEADVGTLEWSAKGFSYRISHTGLGLRCEDLLRIAGSPP
jgi:hypothetical protein